MADREAFDALGAAAELEAALSGEGVSIASLEGDLVALNARLAETESRLRAAEARADRAQEEVARASARLAREAALAVARGTQAILRDTLAILDDLERALEAARSAGAAPAFIEGMELVRRRFLAALATHGVVAIPVLGELFDPQLHEAVSVLPAVSAEQAGRIVAVVRPGYRLGEEVLRPAAVVVARA